MTKRIVSLLAAGAALILAGCVVPPMPNKATPGASGRVVDSVTRQPVAHSEIRSVRSDSVTPFDSTVAATDSTGRFSLRASYHWQGGVAWNPMAGGAWFVGDYSRSTLILVHCSGYRDQVIDLQQAFLKLRSAGKAPGAKSDFVLVYDQDIALDDIALEKLAN